MKKIIILSLFSFLFFSVFLQAEQLPMKQLQDSRIENVTYNPNDIVLIRGQAFVTTQIVFDSKEIIKSVHVGDVSTWNISVSDDLGYTLFVKPTARHAKTNLTVITNHRTYYFQLVVLKDSDEHLVSYAVRFQYPEDEEKKNNRLQRLVKKKRDLNQDKPGIDKPVLNRNYSVWGDVAILPIACYDDGVKTYFKLKSSTRIPAIFAVNNAAGEEQVVTTYYQGEWMTVNQVAPQWNVRQGKRHTGAIFNDQLIDQLNAKGV